MGIENSKSILRGNKYDIALYLGTISFQNQSGYFVFEKYK